MLFTCNYCGSPNMPGSRSCNRPLCKEKELQRQTEEKVRELGLNTFYPRTRPWTS